MAAKLRTRGRRNEDDENSINHSKIVQGNIKSNPVNPLYNEEKYALLIEEWFWSNLSGADAENLLKDCAEGTFLIRGNFTCDFAFAVTYKVQREVENLRVKLNFNDGRLWLRFSDLDQPNLLLGKCGNECLRSFTLQGLIKKLVDKSQEGDVFRLEQNREAGVETIPFKLGKPLLRNIPLKDHCGAVIMRGIRWAKQVAKKVASRNTSFSGGVPVRYF